VNGDGVIDANDRIRTDRTNVPKWNGGLNITGQYRAFDFTVFFQGAAGASMWIQTQSGDFGNYFNEFAEQRWRPDPNAANDPLGMVPHPGYGEFTGPRAFQREEEYWINQRNTYFYRSMDYIRLKNLEIGYNLPSSVAGSLGLERMRVYANGFNLLTFSDFPMDPEASSASGSYYPQKRIVNFGLSIAF
jgi:TonB-dependent starch-binding outer membrane protein SusC